MKQRTVACLYCLLMALLASGCRALPFWPRPAPADLPPVAFAQPPSLEDIIYAVNANTQRVQRLQTENATLRVEGLPSLRAQLAYEAPHNFRLTADLSKFTGRELDLGSNSELFWLWIRRDDPPTMYFARHREFAVSPASDMIPIEPYRLIDALGLVSLDPDTPHLGPFPHDAQTLEIRSRIPTPRGDLSRVLLVDAKYGWMAQQHVYDAGGQLIYSARASRHRYYPEDAVTMPHRMEVRLLPGQPTQLAFEVDVSRYYINRLTGDSAELWSMPVIEGVARVNVADPYFRPPTVAPPPAGSYTTPRGTYGLPGVGPPGIDPSALRGAAFTPYRGYQSYTR